MLRSMIILCCIHFSVYSMKEAALFPIVNYLESIDIAENPSIETFDKLLQVGFDPTCKRDWMEQKGVRPLAIVVGYFCRPNNTEKQQEAYRYMIRQFLLRGMDPNVFCDDIPENWNRASKFCYLIVTRYLRGGSPSMIANIMQANECKFRYDLVVLLLQYGLNKHELSKGKVLQRFNYIHSLSNLVKKNHIDDELKVYMLLFPELVNLSFRNRWTNPPSVFEECKKEIQLEQEMLEPIINCPEDASKEVLVTCAQRAQKNMYALKNYCNIPRYIAYSPLGKGSHIKKYVKQLGLCDIRAKQS